MSTGYSRANASARRIEQARQERLPCADLGNGCYRNPVFAGTYPDPSVVRVGSDYYATHSGSGVPGVLIWHSRDLVNWEPVAKAVNQYVSDIWAPELIHYRGLFYLYLPLRQRRPGEPSRFGNFVCTAKRPDGPWSDLIDLDIQGYIDPGHVADAEGNRYLYVNRGTVIQLAADGLSTEGEPKQVYQGWPYPAEWVVECMCLESPKFCAREGYYYLVSAQGGTSGPSTSHMIVVARSTSPLGPWENSPHNPMLRTRSRAERWWSQGHGTLLDDVAGNWWVMYHAYENEYRTLGRQTLLMPVEWTADGWPRIRGEIAPTDVIEKPPGENVGHGMPLSDAFESKELGLQWRCWHSGDPYQIYTPGGGALRVVAQGDEFDQGSWLACRPVNRSYEVQVDVLCPKGARAGLLLYDTESHGFSGAAVDGSHAYTYWRSRPHASAMPVSEHVYLKIRNLDHDLASSYSLDGETWHRFDRCGEVSSAFGRLQLGLYAGGKGEVVFRNFRYHGLD